jgi:TrmH family RNA methyltransferase
VRRISSRQNSLVTAYRTAISGEQSTQVLLDGLHLVSEAIEAGVHLRHVLVASEALARPDVATLVARAASAGADVVEGSAPVLAAASPVRSPSPIVALAERPQPNGRMFAGPAPLVVIACHVQDPGNLGAIVRVAEAAGASGIFVTGQSANPFGWKALRGSMGSALRVPITTIGDIDAAIDEVRRHRCRVLATVPRGGLSLFESRLKTAAALIVGGEGAGLDDRILSRADERVTVPMQAPVESLNVAVTTALVLYEARRQRR